MPNNKAKKVHRRKRRKRKLRYLRRRMAETMDLVRRRELAEKIRRISPRSELPEML